MANDYIKHSFSIKRGKQSVKIVVFVNVPPKWQMGAVN